MSFEPEIVEYDEASIVGVRYDYFVDGEAPRSVMEHILYQYKLVDDVNKALDRMAEEQNVIEERKWLDQYLIITSDFMLYGIDYNSGFFIPNDWELYQIPSGMYSRVYMENEHIDDHSLKLDAAIAFAKDSSFELDDTNRPVIYKYVPAINHDRNADLMKFDMIINIPVK